MQRDAWNETSAEDRAAMLAYLRAVVQKACDAEEGRGQTVVMSRPAVNVVAAVTTGSGLVVITCSHFRISHLAQSGSDWGEQYIWVTETTFGSGAAVVAERVVERKEIGVSERESSPTTTRPTPPPSSEPDRPRTRDP